MSSPIGMYQHAAMLMVLRPTRRTTAPVCDRHRSGSGSSCFLSSRRALHVAVCF